MNNDEITSDSDYDSPYTETAFDWHQRNLHRQARKRCGMESSSDESLDDFELQDGQTPQDDVGTILFDRWMESFPFIAAHCSLFMQPSGRRSVRDQEAKTLRRVLRKISGKQNNWHTNGNDAEAVSSEEIKYHQLVANSMLPKGLGISFMDAVLSRNLVPKPKQQQKQTLCQAALELNGPARSGMTSILIASAARYVANTSNAFIHTPSTSDIAASSNGPFTSPNTVINEPPSNKRQKIPHYPPTAAAEPRVVFLDLDHGVHTLKLILSVREAVLHRWEESSLARNWRRQQQHGSAAKDTHSIPNAEEVDVIQEQCQIESAIASCLGRIHIIQPRDFTYLSLVATIESLNKRLDDDKLHDKSVNSTVQQPPTLLIIDSLSTLDACTKAQESLPTVSGDSGGSGLSERNEFYRQLQRLREDHEVAIMGSRRMTANETDSSGSVWDKMVTHRVGLHHVADGTEEQRKGFDFVATVKNKGDLVFPYSVTNSGINS